VLVVAAMMVEHYRANPLINTRWLASNDMLRLALAVMLIRVVLSEQSTGAMGFFQSLGLVNDQMHVLFRCMLAGCVLALALSAWLLRPEHVVFHILIAIATMATGAFMDVGATSATRPEQMYLSQFLMAFGSVFFLGPALISGLRVVVTQPRNLVSFVVMFGMAQNLGGLVGSAFLGTFQIVREKYHSSLLNEHLTLADPQVAARVQAYTGAYAHVIGDAAQRQGAALRQLGSVATREANVLAYNDVFLAIGWISLATLAWILGLMAWRRLRPASGLGAGPGLPNAPDPSIPTEPVPHA
jgi:hypothetical protein